MMEPRYTPSMRRWLPVLMAVSIVLPLQTHAAELHIKASAQDTTETAQIIQGPQRLQRFFGSLQRKDDVDYFTMTLKKGDPIHLAMDIPAKDENFYPTIILFGPGLPTPDQDPVIPIGDGNGMIVTSDETDQRPTHFDLYALTTFAQGPTIDTVAPKDATYGIAVRSPNGNKGRYILTTGTTNIFTWSDFMDQFIAALQVLFRIY